MKLFIKVGFIVLVGIVGCRPQKALASPIVRTPVLFATDSLRIITPVQLPGADTFGPLDSVRITHTGPLVRVTKLLKGFGSAWSDTAYTATPPAEQAISGTVCATLFRASKTSQQCAAWTFSGPNAPPPLPTVGPIQVTKVP